MPTLAALLYYSNPHLSTAIDWSLATHPFSLLSEDRLPVLATARHGLPVENHHFYTRHVNPSLRQPHRPSDYTNSHQIRKYRTDAIRLATIKKHGQT